VTKELKRHFTGWTSAVGMDGAALARRIHDDAIDLLVDLSGHTEHGRLDVFAWKPAPVQVSWLGYFATTGLETIDWKLGDRWVTPIEEEHHFVERIWRLPDSCFCYFPPSRAPEVAPLPSQTTGHTTFGCFNNLAKLNDEVVELWSRVLQAAPKSTLLLKARQLESDEIAAHVRSRFERAGVGPDRLVLEGSGSYEDYLRAYARVDVALDPFPYAGGATTADALWMGVPVLTLIGDHYIGHQGESLLHAATLSDWIARDKDDYVRKAVTRAADIASLRELREQLRERVAASPLFDAPRFSRNLGSAWRGMWERWCNGA
jgi:predicted O-linked N-acetylglucosamine transferase (SPINDLY family)